MLAAFFETEDIPVSGFLALKDNYIAQGGKIPQNLLNKINGKKIGDLKNDIPATIETMNMIIGKLNTTSEKIGNLPKPKPEPLGPGITEGSVREHGRGGVSLEDAVVEKRESLFGQVTALDV